MPSYQKPARLTFSRSPTAAPKRTDETSCFAPPRIAAPSLGRPPPAPKRHHHGGSAVSRIGFLPQRGLSRPRKGPTRGDQSFFIPVLPRSNNALRHPPSADPLHDGAKSGLARILLQALPARRHIPPSRLTSSALRSPEPKSQNPPIRGELINCLKVFISGYIRSAPDGRPTNAGALNLIPKE